MRRHTVPTHAGAVEDRLMFGLTVRQLLPLSLAACAAYTLGTTDVLPPLLRFLLAVLVAATGAAVALLRPQGLPLLTYVALRLGHRLGPRRAVWQRAGRSGRVLPGAHHAAPGARRRRGGQP